MCFVAKQAPLSTKRRRPYPCSSIPSGGPYSAAALETVLSAAAAEPEDDTLAMHEIVRRFEPLAKKIASRSTSCPHLRADLQNAGRIAVVRAVRRHDPIERGFPAFAEVYMRGAIYREDEEARRPSRQSPPASESDRPDPESATEAPSATID